MIPILTTQKRQKKKNLQKHNVSQYRRLVKRQLGELNFKNDKLLPGAKGQVNSFIFVRAEKPQVASVEASEKSTKMVMNYYRSSWAYLWV